MQASVLLCYCIRAIGLNDFAIADLSACDGLSLSLLMLHNTQSHAIDA